MFITKRPGSVDMPSPERLFTGNVLRDIGKVMNKIAKDVFTQHRRHSTDLPDKPVSVYVDGVHFHTVCSPFILGNKK